MQKNVKHKKSVKKFQKFKKNAKNTKKQKMQKPQKCKKRKKQSLDFAIVLVSYIYLIPPSNFTVQLSLAKWSWPIIEIKKHLIDPIKKINIWNDNGVKLFIPLYQQGSI